MSKNHPKIHTKPPSGGYGNKQRDLALLKRDRDIGRNTVLSDVKTAFRCTPALPANLQRFFPVSFSLDPTTELDYLKEAKIKNSTRVLTITIFFHCFYFLVFVTCAAILDTLMIK